MKRTTPLLRTLDIQSGLHVGAQRLLPPGEYVLGSGAGCDIILRDPGIAERHLLLVLGEVTVFAKPLTDAPWQCSGRDVKAGRQLLSEHDVITLGTVRLSIATASRVPAEATPAGQAAPPQGAAANDAKGARPPLGLRRLSMVVSSVVVSAGFLLFAFHAAVSSASERSRSEQLLASSKRLVESLNLPDLRIELDAKGGLVLRGHVHTAQDAQRVRSLTELYANGAPAMKFHVASELVQRATEYLDDPGLSVQYAGGGKLVVGGRSTRAETRARKDQWLNDMRGVAEIEVVATLIDDQAPDPTSMELPVKVVGIYGATGGGAYFRSEDGARYSEGNVLKNGAEVVSINSNQIVFRFAGKVFSYNAPETGVIHD